MSVTVISPSPFISLFTQWGPAGISNDTGHETV